MKIKKILLIATVLLFTSCVNMGIYDGTPVKDNLGNEYMLNYAYGGYYFLEVKNDSGYYIPDNRYVRLKNKELKRKNK